MPSVIMRGKTVRNGRLEGVLLSVPCELLHRMLHPEISASDGMLTLAPVDSPEPPPVDPRYARYGDLSVLVPPQAGRMTVATIKGHSA